MTIGENQIKFETVLLPVEYHSRVSRDDRVIGCVAFNTLALFRRVHQSSPGLSGHVARCKMTVA